jgi:hypothetical protein
MTLTTNVSNGRARKTLAEQIDRLDGILDGLANGLNEAVATVVQESVGIAVREAVQAVLAELLTNPAVLARLQGSAASVPSLQPQPPAARAGGWFNAIGTSIGGACGRVGASIQRGCGHVCGLARFVWRGACRSIGVACGVARPLALFKGQLLAAFGVGVAAGAAAYFAGPWLAALASGSGAFATTLVVQIGWWLRRTLEGLAAAWD